MRNALRGLVVAVIGLSVAGCGIARRAEFQARTGELNAQAKTVLTRRLMREGLVTIARNADSLHMRNHGGQPNSLAAKTAPETQWQNSNSAEHTLDAEVNVES